MRCGMGKREGRACGKDKAEMAASKRRPFALRKAAFHAAIYVLLQCENRQFEKAVVKLVIIHENM